MAQALKPSISVDFINGGQLDPRLTCSRPAPATRFNRLGKIVLAAANELRIDYDPLTFARKGARIEEQRANMVLQRGWPAAGAGSPGTAPTGWIFGTVGTPTLALPMSIYGDADSGQALTFGATAAGDRNYCQQSITVVSGQSYVVWCYVEAVVSTPRVVLALSVGTATYTETSVSNRDNPTAGPGAIASINFTATSSGTVNARFGVGTSTGSGVAAGASVTLSRPQLELGSFPTSSIPTAGSQVTRPGDSLSLGGAAFAGLWNPVEGGLVIETERFADQVFAQAVNISDGGTANVIAVGHGSAPYPLRLNVSVGGVSQASITGIAAPALLTRQKVAAGWRLDDFAISGNGAAPAIGTSGAIPSGMTGMGIGYRVPTSSHHLNGWLRTFALYAKRPSNADLQALSV